MTKLFRKILLSTFAVGATLFIGNKAFAQDYKVNIAVAGDLQTGKTQIIRRIFKEEFQENRDSSPWWDHGVYGKQKSYEIGDDTFHCRYYDAPGYLQETDATLDQQIDSKAIKDANIALIVVDPQQEAGIEARYLGSSLQEVFVRHVSHIFAVNPKCKIIVVANKIDNIEDPTELAKYRTRMEHFRLTYDHCEADGIFTSAKTGEGIPELEGKIKNLLALNRAELPKGCHDFVICKCKHTVEGTANDCKRSYSGDLYCSVGCLREFEAKRCSRSACPNEAKYLRNVDKNVAISPRTGKLYCCTECYTLAEIGESCARGDKCPNKDKKYFRDKSEGFVSKHTDKLYCGKKCYKEKEGTRCSHDGCDEKFVVADGESFYRSLDPDSDKKYCESHKTEAAGKKCILL